jgi:hypothetical protein
VFNFPVHDFLISDLVVYIEGSDEPEHTPCNRVKLNPKVYIYPQIKASFDWISLKTRCHPVIVMRRIEVGACQKVSSTDYTTLEKRAKGNAL